MKESIALGRERGENDGCRRYMPAAFHFDSRAMLLETEIMDDWEESVKQQWHRNKEILRTRLVHEYGNEEHERKIADFVAMGQAPWSIIAPHNNVVIDVRRSFAFGSYYSSLLGTVGLAERILNDLVLTLRESYSEYNATRKVKDKQSFNDWHVMIGALEEWGILDDDHAKKCEQLSRIRHSSVHYRSDRNLDARDTCLSAMSLLRDLISHVFSPHGTSPRFIEGTRGQSFIARDAERHPLIQHYFIPSCALVSPDFEYRNNCEELWDERDYGAAEGAAELSDEAFAKRYNSNSSPSTDEGDTDYH